MSTRAWDDMIAGDRMAVDREFATEIENSRFNRQQWGLIMTAVEFDIEHPEDEDRARLVANTEKLPHVMDELDNMNSRREMGGGGDDTSESGVFGSLRRTLGFGGGEADGGKRDAAERLTQRYAEQLQVRLEERGKWADIRNAAQN